MIDTVSEQGGFVWAYLPDLSRRWGELEARPTMIWMQPPGTATMGHLLLDLHVASGDGFFYDAAARVGRAVLAAQLECGGWNYVADRAGEESLRDWYATVGAHAWRLEEFHYYDGNATFDDRTTAEAASFLARLHLARRDPAFRAGLDRAIGFVLASQHATGGWPQRFPPVETLEPGRRVDYTRYLTFNDDVAAENIEFLVYCHQTLGDDRLIEPIRRGMSFFALAQMPAPQAGWALQYTHDLQPASARSYEPKALMTQTTARNIERLLHFFRLTGDTRLIARIPEAIRWLESVRLPAGIAPGGATHPTFVELETGRPLYLHRSGSNVRNGRYFVDGNPAGTVAHYASFRHIDVEGLRRAYARVLALSPETLAAASPLRPGLPPQPPSRRFFVLEVEEGAGGSASPGRGTLAQRARQVIAAMREDGAWIEPLALTSHPYRPGDAPAPGGRDYSRDLVGDETDTSPYRAPTPVPGISTSVFLRNMQVLARHLLHLP